MKRYIQEDSLSNIDSIAKKLKEESKIFFKFVGFKKQFCFNLGLAEKIHAASTALGNRKLEVVRDFLEELDSDIKKHNKLIRLTDKSAAGWDLVSEYFLDELASAFDLQSIIRGTEQRALRKRKDRQQQKWKSTVKQSRHLPPPLHLLINISIQLQALFSLLYVYWQSKTWRDLFRVLSATLLEVPVAG